MRQLNEADRGMLRVDPSPSSAAMARHRIRASLDAIGMPQALVDDVLLVATELIGNAVRHAFPLSAGDLEVCWKVDHEVHHEVDRDRVTVQVSDGGGPQPPHVRASEPHATAGRGLMIVATVAQDWGVETHSDGVTTVWARLV
jgi:serine/threonine-protein kinase RsbW